MALAVWIVVAVVIFAVVAIIKISSEKQKVAIRLLLILFVFFVITASYVGIKSGADIKNFDSLMYIGKIYFSWLGAIIKNMVSVTGYAVDLNWGINNTNASINEISGG